MECKLGYRIIIMERRMTMENKYTLSQTNSIGGKGTQIATQNNYYGMSYSDTKTLCLDLIKVELDNYKETAALEAKRRNDELLNSFIKKIQEEQIDKDTVGKEFKNPDMQYTYIDAQKRIYAQEQKI